MHRLIPMVASAAVSLVLVGCAERANAPTAVRPAAPSFEIRDGAHNNGNPHFYFLPPIVASPNATGSFDATQAPSVTVRSEEHTSELQSQSNLVCRLLLEK